MHHPRRPDGQIETGIEASRIDALRPALLFIALVAVLLLPSFLNGYPFVMDDSIAYSGQGINWIRSKTAAATAAPLYGLVGFWALPILNAILAASAWLVLSISFGIRQWQFVALPIAVLALQPVYASAVLVDIWFFPAMIFLVVALQRSSPFLALLSGLLLSAHGSGLWLAVAFAVGTAAILRRPRYLIYTGLAVATSIAVTTALDLKHHPDTPRLEKTFLASRLFSVHPELLRIECERSGEAVLCAAADVVTALKVDPAHHGRRDFIWDLQARFGERFDLVRFERDHALPIIVSALRHDPTETIRSMIGDLASFYAPDTRFDFTGTLVETMPERYYGSLQYRENLMQHDTVRTAATAFRYLLYGLVAGVLAWRWRAIAAEDRRWIGLLVALSVANDILFAILSGPPDRYHHRILGLLGAAMLIALSDRNLGRARLGGSATAMTTRE